MADMTKAQALEKLQELILRLDSEGDAVLRNELVSIGRAFRDNATPDEQRHASPSAVTEREEGQ